MTTNHLRLLTWLYHHYNARVRTSVAKQNSKWELTDETIFMYTMYIYININMHKTFKITFIAIKIDQGFDIYIEENATITIVQKFKYLGVSLNKRFKNEKYIINKICKEREIIGCLSSLWWDKNISLDTKKLLEKAMIESVTYYVCKVWLFKTEEQRKLLALEMDYLRRSAIVPRLQKIPNTTIRRKMQ